MLNMDEKRINMADFAKSAAKYLFQRHCKKSTNNEDFGIFEILLVTTKNPQIPVIFGSKSVILAIDRGIYPDFSVNIMNGVLGMLKSNTVTWNDSR